MQPWSRAEGSAAVSALVAVLGQLLVVVLSERILSPAEGC